MNLLPEWWPPDEVSGWPAADVATIPVGPHRAAAPGRLPSAAPLRSGRVFFGSGRPVVPRPFDGSTPPPSLWISDAVVPDAASAWSALADQFADTGLWPLRLHSLYDGSGRPWNSGELEPVPESAVDAVDVRDVLARGWRDSLVPIRNPWPPGTGPLAPFGHEFPGLAPAQPEAHSSPAEFTAGPARLGLVSCRRPADAVALTGWKGAINVTGAAQVSAVLRSWEDRFGAVLVGLSFATLTLVVTRPPVTDEDALRVAAEIAAFCPDALWQPEELSPSPPREATLESMSRLLARERVWRLWFD